MEAELEELLNKNLIIVKKIEKKASMFSKSIFALSVLDLIFGVLAIFCSSLQLLSLFAGLTSATTITICGRIIKVKQIRAIEKGLRTLDLISLTWFVNKYNKYLKENNRKMKETKFTVLQKILAIVIAIFGVGGVVVSFFPAFTGVSQQVSTIISAISSSISVASGIWLASTNDKVLTDEEKAKIEQDAKNKKKAKAQAFLDKIHDAEKIVNE